MCDCIVACVLGVIQPSALAASSTPCDTCQSVRESMACWGVWLRCQRVRLWAQDESLQDILLQLVKTGDREVCLLSCVLPAMVVTLLLRGLPKCQLTPGQPYELQCAFHTSITMCQLAAAPSAVCPIPKIACRCLATRGRANWSRSASGTWAAAGAPTSGRASCCSHACSWSSAT